MISTLTIEGFRCFERLEMGALGRVNLIVGKNNSGKTSVLEALDLLSSGGDPAVLWALAEKRGEVSQTNGSHGRSIEIVHFFHGHSANIGAEFRLVAKEDMVAE